jgi:phage baseplate assembly protein gpV
MSLLNIIKPGANLHGLMEGIVLDRDDPKKEGRVGVFISRVMGLIPNSSSKEPGQLITSSTSKDDDSNAVSGQAALSSINYLWAKRANRNGKSNFGEWIIPTVGSSVFVFFLDGDPTQLYYLPFGPGDRNSKPSKAANVNEVVLHQTLSGSKIGFSNGGKDKFYVELPDGSGIIISPKEQTVEIMTKDSAAKVAMKEGKIDIKAESVTIAANDIILKTPDGALWMPNIVPNCPLGGFPHGGQQAGLTHIKGDINTPEAG